MDGVDEKEQELVRIVLLVARVLPIEIAHDRFEIVGELRERVARVVPEGLEDLYERFGHFERVRLIENGIFDVAHIDFIAFAKNVQRQWFRMAQALDDSIDEARIRRIEFRMGRRGKHLPCISAVFQSVQEGNVLRSGCARPSR